MTLNAQEFGGQNVIGQGTVVLAAGNNTLFQNQNLWVSPNATLDLDGGNLFAATVLTPNSVVIKDAGGIVTNSSSTQSIFSLATGNNWGGSINGNIAVDRSQTTGGFVDWTVHSANNFTGPLVAWRSRQSHGGRNLPERRLHRHQLRQPPHRKPGRQ